LIAKGITILLLLPYYSTISTTTTTTTKANREADRKAKALLVIYHRSFPSHLNGSDGNRFYAALDNKISP